MKILSEKGFFDVCLLNQHGLTCDTYYSKLTVFTLVEQRCRVNRWQDSCTFPHDSLAL